MFYCPIHKVNDFLEIDEDCHIDTITYYICPECFEIKKSVSVITDWFHNTQKKLNSDIKKQLKIAPLEYYEVHLMCRESLESYQSYRYIDNQITEIHLYQMCGFVFRIKNAPTKNRMMVRTFRKIRYGDISVEDFSIETLRDDKLIQNILK